MRNSPLIAVSCTDSEFEIQAKHLANILHLPLAPLQTKSYLLLLVVTPEKLELRYLGKPKLNAIYVDFLAGKLDYRRKQGGGTQQLIARAVGITSKKLISVLDLTAGLGQDAFVLATLGCDVTMLERNAVIAALLQDGLTRAHTIDWFQQLKLNLVSAEASDYLNKLSSQQLPDVIYLDPMFPDTKRTAAVKKEMRILRLIVGDDWDAEKIFELSLKKARKRIVVKRPRLAPRISSTKIPDVVYEGKSSRFDVYLIN